MKLLIFMSLIISSITTVSAQYPTKTVRIIVPGPASGGADLLTRIVSNELTKIWGRQVIVDNRPGASGMIGTELAAKSVADGYTLLTGHSGTHAINVSIQSNIRYDPIRDFTPIHLFAITPNVLVGHPSLPVKTVKDLINFIKERPEKINYSSGGVGFSQHLAGVLFCMMTNLQIKHVPYKGGTPALIDVVSGNVELMFPNIPAAISFIQSGKLRVFGVTSSKRSQALPFVPTISESGLKGYEAVGWFGLFAPAKTSELIVKSINEEIGRILRKQNIAEQYKALGADSLETTTEQFGEFVASEIKKWAVIVKKSGLTLSD